MKSPQSPKLVELRRTWLSLKEEAFECLEKLKACPASDDGQFRSLEREHDKLMRRMDHVQTDITEELMRLEDEEEGRSASEARERRRPGSAVSVNGADGYSIADTSGWSDERGKPVRVLGPSDKWSNGSMQGAGLGDAVRAMVTGARTDAERRALSEGTDSAGGYTVPTPLALEFIDKLRRRSVINRAGARFVPMTSSTLAIAKLTGDPTVAWRGEGDSVAESDPTFGRVLFTAKSCATIVKVTRELFADTVNSGAMVEQALIQATALELDRVALYGDGTNDAPTGIINTAGINEVSMGTNGAALADYDKLIDAIYELQLDNVEEIGAGIMHPRTGASLAKLKDSAGNPLVAPEMVRNIPLISTTAAPIDETQGTATNASSIIYGDYRHLLIGMREDINIRILTELYAGTGHIGILVHMRADVQLSWAAAFNRLKGIKPA